MKKILLAIFSILLFSDMHYGQSPGGVSTNLQLWYKANAGITLSGTNNVTQWNNSASLSYNLIQQGTATTVPSYNSGNTNQINFNPSVRFDGVDDRLYTANVPQNLTTSSSAPYTTSQYVVYRKLGSNVGTIYSHSDGGGGTWNIGAGANGNMLVTNRSIFTSAPVANEVRLQEIDGNSNAASSYLNGEQKSTSFSGGTATSGTRPFWLGAQGTNGFSNTDIAEVVIYNTAQSNRDRIESYLCLKYGIGKFGNYTASNGTTIYWNTGINAGYVNNVAGIGRDNNSGVYQKQSMNQSLGNQVLIGLTSMADTNGGNTGALVDNQYLMWGDNGLAKALRVPLSHNVSGIEINSRFGSIWKVQNTGNIGTVRVMWPVGVKNLHLVQSTDETISATDTFIAMTATQTINGVAYNYADVSLADGQYFTFAGYGNSPGGVMFPTVWLKANEGVNTDNNGLVQEWINQGSAISLPNVLQATPNNRPNLLTSGLNFNPAVYHQDNNRSLLNTSGVIGPDIWNSVTEYSHFTVSKALSGSTVWNYGNRGANSYIGYEQSLARARFFQRNNEISVDNTSGVNAFDPASALLLSSSNRNGNVYFNFSNGQTNTLAPSSGNVDLTNPSFRIGTTSNGFAYQGSTPEIIIYGRSLSDTEQAQVRSYLAIKYGMSLGKQDLAYNYVNSKGIVIWNGTGNTSYNNNIAGIGRDDFSLLYQKQSMSSNSESQVLIGLSGMADINAANTGTLADQQYLIWGDNGLKKSLSVAITGIADVNFRFESIWKVQNTGSVGTLRIMWPQGLHNLKLIQNASDPTFSAGNISTDMSANTQTINGIVYNYADVILADGQYFTFAAQVYAPGGIASGLEAWHKADSYAYTDNGSTLAASGQAIQRWNDFNGSGMDFVQTTAGNKPTYTPNSVLNFNPTVRFTRSANNFMSYTSSSSSIKTQGSLYFAVKQATLGIGSGFLGFDNSLDYPGWHTMADNHYLIYNTNFTPKLTNLIDITIPNLVGSSWKNGAGSTTGNILFDTHYNGFAQSFGTVPNINNTTSVYRVGSDTNYGAYDGNVGEVIYYSRDLTPLEKSQVDSYLAIKYGTTLRSTNFTTGTFDYLNSSGNVIWNGATTNSTYHNNVTGIGRDDVAALSQKQSMSSNPGSQVLIGIGGTLANANALNTNSFPTDKQYLIWGDNGLKKSLSVTITGIANVNFRFGSIWKVQNTGNIGTVRIMWPAGVKNIKLIQNTDAGFTTGNVVTDMSGNTQVINGVTYNYAEVSLADGQYFTFAGYGHAPGGVLNALQTWYRADDGVSVGAQWNDQVQGKNVIQPTSSRQPTLTQSSSTFNFNFNPYFDFNRGASQKMWLENPNILSAGFTGGSIYTVSRRNPSNNGMDQTIAGFGDDNPNLQASNQTSYRLYLNNGPGIDSYNVGGLMYTANGAHMHWNNSGSNILEHNGIQVPGSNRSSTPGGTFVIGGEGASSGTGGGENWNGGIGEVIVYDQNLALTPSENIKVNSYLALKYGFTLGNSATVANYDYISAVGTKIWDSSVNTSYNKNIFGIGRDDISVLHQKVANSVNPGIILAVSTSNNFTLSNLDASRAGLSADSTFLIFGDNNDTSTLPYTPAEIGDCGEVIGGENEIKLIPRKWMVQRTGQVGSTYLQANLSAYSGGINTGIFMLVADDVNFTQNVVKIPGSQGTGGNWVFSYNFDNSNAKRYITFGGEFEAGSCETCKGGTYTLRTGDQWNTNATPWANQISNKKENILLGTDAEGTQLYASMYADYSVDPSIEYNPNRYPARYGGRWAISRRYDNTNAKVKHTIQLSKAMKASFQLSNINTYQNNKNNFEVIGYCGGVPVMPKITYGYNTSYHTFTIDGNKTTGTMSWRGFTPNVSTANVRFDRPVERIVIICSVDRVNTQKTLRSVTYSDITLECQETVEPTPDNVYVSHNFTQGTLSTCGGDTTMRIKVTNNNICDDKVINLTQTLPAGLSFANGSFNGLELPAGALDSAAVSISGNTFSITGLKIPQGEYWMYVDIANPGTASTYATQFSYQVTNGIAPTTTYQSSVVDLVYYQAGVLPPSPILTQTIKEVVSGAVSCGKNNIQITYRMKINNVNTVPLTGAEILQAFDYDQTIAAVNYVNNEDQNGVITGEYPTDGSGNPIVPVGSALYSLSNATIPVGISYIDITVNVGNSYDITEVKNMGISAAFQISIDPGGECAENSESSSNETILKWCGPHCVKPGASGTALVSTIGISTKLNPSVDNWPASTPNGYLVLDAVNKGLVITHMTTEQINALVPVKGMIVYDTTEGRVKIYRGNNTDNKPVIDEDRYGWQPITRSCNDR